jgi:hypothetical protein
MPKPLQFGDPGELGPFRLESRLHESAAGIVYLGVDPQGRRVEVALLTTAAAGDPAARDRFRAAVAAEAPRASAFPGGPPAGGGPGNPAPVVAALHDSGAPWVATAHEEGRAGAERFLRPVLLGRGWGLGRRGRGGPSFQQYWVSGPKGPAVHVPEPARAGAGGPEGPGDSKGLAAAAVSLAALLALLALLVLLLFSCEPTDPGPPRPTDLPTTAPLPPPPVEPPPSPSSPSPSHKRSRTPRPTPTGGDGTVNPAGRSDSPAGRDAS